METESERGFLGTGYWVLGTGYWVLGTALLDAHQSARRLRRRRRPLGSSPRIQDRHLVHARYRAMRRARLLRLELAAQIGKRISLQRNARVPALLRAVMHQPVLANIEVARPGPAAPLVRAAQRDVVLKRIHPRKAAFLQSLHLVVHAPFFVVQGLQLPRVVVNDADG